MARPAEIRLVGDESQDRDDRTHRDDGAILLTNATRKYDGRQAPDEHPGGPVERWCKFTGGSSAVPPSSQQGERRKLEVDGEVDPEPEEGFDERKSSLEVIEAVAGAHRGCTYEPDYIERNDDQMLRRVGKCPVAWQKENEDHRSEKCIGEPEAAPYPEGKDDTGSGNQEPGCVRLRRK